MHIQNSREAESTAEDRADESKPRERSHGSVVDCNGTHAIIVVELKADADDIENYWTVGQLISIWEGSNRVVGQCFQVDSPQQSWSDSSSNMIHVHIELVGEIQDKNGVLNFTSGISAYPRMGSVAHRIRSKDLEAIYQNDASDTIGIGHLTQETSIPAKIELAKLLSRHFAIVGSTGVGKSTAVSLLLRKIIANRKDVRVVILDPHNEFTSAFPSDSVVKDASNLQLPFWLFRFEEFTEVVFRGQNGVEAETELLRDTITEAKELYAASENSQSSTVRRGRSGQGYTADSLVPYRMVDLLKVIDERLGLLDGKREKPHLKALQDRLNAICKDPRFEFMFGAAASGGDKMKSIISDLFRVPCNDRPICVVEMSGLPSEVMSSVVSVLCRLAFDLGMSSQGAIQTLIVCEEAHRYIPANRDAGFWPTRQSIARIAKEGRKYGVFLGIVSQRPSELDPTILSQCNTVFAMRLANHGDQNIIKDALTNGAQSTIQFLASIANRECIAFGEALKTPMRMTFETVEKEALPGGSIQKIQQAVRDGQAIDLASVIQRMRGEAPRTGDDDFEAELGGSLSGGRRFNSLGSLADDKTPDGETHRRLQAAKADAADGAQQQNREKTSPEQSDEVPLAEQLENTAEKIARLEEALRNAPMRQMQKSVEPSHRGSTAGTKQLIDSFRSR